MVFREITGELQLDAPINAPLPRFREIGADVQLDVPEEPGFFGRIGEDIESRTEQVTQARQRTSRGEQGQLQQAIQLTGIGAGSALDVVGETAMTAAEAVTPDFVIDAAKAAGNAFLETSVGRKAAELFQAGVEEFAEFEEENPAEAATVRALANIGILAAPVKIRPKVGAKKPSILEKTAEKLTTKAETQAAKEKRAFVEDLITPQQTKKIREEQVARTSQKGILASKEIAPTPQQVAVAEEVAKLPVSKKNTIQENFNVIQKANLQEAKTLKGALAKNEVIFPRKEFNAALEGAITRLRENPSLVGDAAKQSIKIIDLMKKAAANSKSTGSGLLAARKKFDREVAKFKPKSFEPATENAFSTALREVRQTTNDFIDARATSVGVKESLKKQSNLFRAMDDIVPKAAVEAKNAFSRLIQNALNVVPLRNELARVGGLGLGIAGFGSIAFFAKPFAIAAGTAGAASLAVKAALSPAAKKRLAGLLKVTDKAMKEIKDKNILRQMRTDRAILLELLEGSEAPQGSSNNSR